MVILLILHTGDKALAFSRPDQDEVADDLGEIQGQVRGMWNRRGQTGGVAGSAILESRFKILRFPGLVREERA